MCWLNVCLFVFVVASASALDDSRAKLTDALTNDDTSIENRIIQGQETTIEKFPHQVAMVIRNEYFCGGSIISENWILTAAHCLEKAQPSTVEVRAGSTFNHNGTIIKIAELISHPGYDNPRYNKDIAVMKTAEPITFGPTMQPIALPPVGKMIEANSDIDVSGWGLTENGMPKHLMSVTLEVISHMKCKLSYFLYLTENMWCAGDFLTGGKAICSGDSGGAAVQNGVALGVVSFSRGCGFPLSPSVFAATYSPSNRNFIFETTGL